MFFLASRIKKGNQKARDSPIEAASTAMLAALLNWLVY